MVRGLVAAGQFEHVADDLVEVVELRHDRLLELDALVGGETVRVKEDLDVAPQGGHRRAEFVRGIGDEASSRKLRLADRADHRCHRGPGDQQPRARREQHADTDQHEIVDDEAVERRVDLGERKRHLNGAGVARVGDGEDLDVRAADMGREVRASLAGASDLEHLLGHR